MKETKGITLIALIITIIIMLILVAVTVSIVINGGLIGKAKDAASGYKKSAFYEEVSMVLADRKLWEYTETEGSLEQSLRDGISGEKTVEAVPGVADVCYVTKDGTTLTVYEDGEIIEGRVEIWGGTSSAPVCPEFKENEDEEGVWDWYIYTPAQFYFLQEFVNNGNQLEGDAGSLTTIAGDNASKVTMVDSKTVVYLMNDLDMGAREGTGSTAEEKWETTANEAKNWTPIGIDKEDTGKFFKGIFNGQNHTIKGIYVNTTKTENGNGIFGRGNTIKNLTVKNSYIKGTSNRTGGIIGCLDKGEITHCYNINTYVRGALAVGGIVGQSARTPIRFCGNTGNIASSQEGAGGISGFQALSFTEYCYNLGDVSGCYAGGIQGGSYVHGRYRCIILL